MKILISLILIFLSNKSLADSANAKVMMNVSGYVRISEKVKLKDNNIIRTHHISTSPNQMLTIQYKRNSITRSSGAEGEVKMNTRKNIEIFF